MTPDDSVRFVLAELERHGIPYMVAGSHASSYHGEPRTTNDVDLIIDPSKAALDAFVAALPADRFYVSPEAATDAFRRRGLFNVIDPQTGVKVDLVLRKNRPFSVAEFERRQPAQIFGTAVFVATREDTILAKLEWALLGESERQLRDVAGIIAMSGAALDRAYIERWAPELGLTALWERAQREADDD